MKFVFTDGGRGRYYKGTAGDCVVRAICVATGRDYKEVYAELARRNLKATGKRSCRNGVAREAYEAYLRDAGWRWVPAMKIGSGCKLHLADGAFGRGTYIVRVTKHLTCVKDGAIYDAFDPSRGGTRCVYGYFVPHTEEAKAEAERARSYAPGTLL